VRVSDHLPNWGPFNDGGRQLRLAVSGNLEFNQNAPAIAACAAGMGLGMFLSYQVAPFLKTRQLRIVLEDFEPPARPVQVVYPSARLLPMRTRVFIDWIKKELGEFRA
jgi:DNA-binding transcriptional LysR family regulator